MWYERSHAKATLTYRYAPSAALWYSRAWRNRRKPDLVFSPTFISPALSDINSDALQEEENSQGNFIFDDFEVIFCDDGSDIAL